MANEPTNQGIQAQPSPPAPQGVQTQPSPPAPQGIQTQPSPPAPQGIQSQPSPPAAPPQPLFDPQATSAILNGAAYGAATGGALGLAYVVLDLALSRGVSWQLLALEACCIGVGAVAGGLIWALNDAAAKTA